MKKYYLLFVAMIGLFITSCEKSNTGEKESDSNTPAESIIIINEGNWGSIDASLAKYNIEEDDLIDDFFEDNNGRRLGDLANDMIKYGSKVYISVNKSNTIEVLNIKTGKSTQISMQDEGKGKGPNKMVAYEGKVYVTSYDRTVTRIDTSSLKREASIEVGRDPEGICAFDGKLYVANSGGLATPNYDNTVSIIDVATFKEDKKIEVGENLYQIQADSKGNIYVSSRPLYDGEDWNNPVGEAVLRVLNPKNGEVKTIENIKPSKFTISNNIAYIVIEDYTKPVVASYDVMAGKIIKDNILPVDYKMSTPYSISVDSKSSNIYLTETDYKALGNVHAFDKDGNPLYKITDTGMNPTIVIEL